MKTLYLHIGSPRTGTTSIQHFCHVNKDVLEEKGYCFPIFPHDYPHNRSRLNPARRNGLFLEAVYMDENGVRDKEKEAEILKDGMERLQEVFETYDQVILSDEGIWRAATKRRKSIWRDLHKEAEKGGFIVKVIAYIRRQDELVKSWWNQTVKHGISESNAMKWERYLEVYPQYINLDYFTLLKAAADEFGVENIIVRRFHKKYFVDGSLLADFMDILGLRLTDEYRIPEQSVKNTRMSENLCEIKRIINGMPEVELKERWRYERLLRDLSEHSDGETLRRMFSPAEASDFMEKYADSNEQLYQMFFADGGSLFLEKDDPPEKWKKDNPDMLTDLVRFIVICDLDRKEQISFMHRLRNKIQTFMKKLRNRWSSDMAA